MVRSEPAKPTAVASGAGEEFAVAIFDVLLRVVSMSVKATWLLVCWAVAFPMFSVPLLVSSDITYMRGWPAGVGASIGFAVILVGWRLAGPGSFRRWVSGRIWGRWRRWHVYRRPWADTCALHGLTATLNEQILVPRLHRAKIGSAVDVLTVRLLPGQSLADWQGQFAALAHAFGAMRVRIRSSQPGWLLIEVQHTDPLAALVPVPGPGKAVDLEHVPVGVTESGDHWSIRLLGRHVLVAGATGAGKGSVVWSILSSLAPAIQNGLVQAWVIDPKGGMEFGPGQALFTRFAYDSGELTLRLLRDAAWVMTSRAASLRGVTRQHMPSVAEPLVLVVIDEIAALTAYLTDRKIKTEVEQLLGLLLSQGRAVGVSVVACVQDPAKDVLAMRQLFPTRVGLRLTEAPQVAMVLGQGARDRGAVCELIPDTLPGVGYVAEDGRSEIARVRAFHVTDDDINRLARDYAPRHTTDGTGSFGTQPWPEAA